MDLVTCPNCRFAFSPTPGKAIKCPSCMTALSAGGKSVSAKVAAPKGSPVKAGVPAKKAAPEPRRPKPPEKSNSKAMLIASVVIVLVLGGGVVGFNMMTSKGAKKSTTVAAGKNADVVPEVLVPRPAPAPVGTPSVDEPDSGIVLPEGPTPTKPKAKIRPIDRSDAPQVVAPPPKAQDKVKKLVVREVPGVTPAALNSTIAKGVKFLTGSSAIWANDQYFRLGYVAIGGLTLLECRSPRDELVVKQAAELTRQLAVNNNMTYEISLAIMFLERLGDPKDRKLIQHLSARLIAGQFASGGFSYECPVLTVAESNALLGYLDRSRPRKAPAPLNLDIGEKTGEKLDLPKSLDGGLTPFERPNPEQQAAIISADINATILDGEKLVSLPPAIRPKSRLTGNAGTVRAETGKVASPAGLSPRLLAIPAVANAGRDKEQLNLVISDFPQTDHSNTQFAILALFVARRHGVASDRAILLAEARMRQIQGSDGGWLYEIQPKGTPVAADTTKHEAMVCAGILSLALGHAVHQANLAGMEHALVTDRQLIAATKRLGQVVKDPVDDIANAKPTATTYLLWSVERVAVLYNSPTIEGKDWYGWGSQMLIQNQQENGSWTMGGYTGSSAHIDTCFALLFLVRSNLVQEVSSSSHVPLQVPLPEGPP